MQKKAIIKGAGTGGLSNRFMKGWLRLFPLDAAGTQEAVAIHYHHSAGSESISGNPRSAPVDTDPSFADFIFRKERNIVWLAAMIILIQFVVFKIAYPYANFIYDSNFYIDAAVHNVNISIWPVAYSKILRLFNVFTHSDLAVVTFQYLLLESAILYFYFTLRYFLHPGKWISRLILALLMINPAILSISNYILSDSIFTALTIAWFTMLLWNLFRPKPVQVCLLAVLLFFLFMLRYYAIFYPAITFAVILLSKLPGKIKASGVGLSTLLIAGFIWHTTNQYEKLLGHREFSAFSGWQIAGNAMIMYRNLHDYSKDTPPVPLLPLHRLVTRELDSINRLKARPDSSTQFFYMWNEQSPLRRYMNMHYQKDSTTPYFKRWASMGSLFKQYGLFLVEKHPLAYIRYYMGPGLQWFAVPTDEALKTYNDGHDSVSQQVMDWFDYRSRRVTSVSKNIYAISAYPVILAILNGLVMLMMVGYFLLSCYKQASPDFRKAILLAGSYWIINFSFSIVSAPMMLRYQLFIMILDIAFGLILVEAIYKSDQIPVTSLIPMAAVNEEMTEIKDPPPIIYT